MMRVLLVEDSDGVRRRSCTMELADVARRGGRAAPSRRRSPRRSTMLAAAPADCVLLDLVLPDAVELRGARRRCAPPRPELPVVVLTRPGRATTLALRAVKAGAQDVPDQGRDARARCCCAPCATRSSASTPSGAWPRWR